MAVTQEQIDQAKIIQVAATIDQNTAVRLVAGAWSGKPYVIEVGCIFNPRANYCCSRNSSYIVYSSKQLKRIFGTGIIPMQQM